VSFFISAGQKAVFSFLSVIRYIGTGWGSLAAKNTLEGFHA
jgi:hypothetical protein